MKNKRGSFFFGVVVGIFLFIMGVLFMPFISDDITTARDALQCATDTISGGTMLTCLTIDLVMPYLIIFFVSVALGFIAGSGK